MYKYFGNNVSSELENLSIKYKLFLIYNLCLKFEITTTAIVNNLKFDLNEIFQ